MVDFNDAQQSKKFKEIRDKEEEIFVERIAQKEGIPYIKLSTTNVETDALILLSEQEARTAFIAPFKIASNILYIGVKSLGLPATQNKINLFKHQYDDVVVYLVSSPSLERAWSLYKDIANTSRVHGGMLDISEERLTQIASEINTNDKITTAIQETLEDQGGKKVSELMEIIFGGAIATESSDVHIEAQDEQVRIRFRQDGVLQDLAYISHEVYGKILSRIKLLSEMKITQTENAQDGRFTIDYNNSEIEVRVSVIPSAYGESFVMRLLNPDGIKVGVENLGIEPRLYEILLREIKKPNGMILTTGPTGSGKTTTLYSFMNKVYNPEVKIITIEDPIEYHLAGVSQTQVNREKGYTFLSGLRAALRQDPDIVMVGEIRDSETANIAVNASLTGHLVLSTLHTNGAAGVIPRLIDLGVSPQILAAALSVSLAQRLVRKVCDHCKYQIEPTEYQKQTIQAVLDQAVTNNKPLYEYGISSEQDIVLYEGRGCDTCNQTGYKGRIGIFEAIITDEKIEALLNKKPSEQDVRKVAETQGLLNMREDGIIKILGGITSFSEVEKVVDLDVENNTANKLRPQFKKVNPEPVVDTNNLEPNALFGNKSVEISLLTDYLKKLEHEQIINPEKSIANQIAQVRDTIKHLMNTKKPEELFGEHTELTDTHKKISSTLENLEELHQQQVQNPSIDMSQKLRRLREDIEYEN